MTVTPPVAPPLPEPIITPLSSDDTHSNFETSAPSSTPPDYEEVTCTDNEPNTISTPYPYLSSPTDPQNNQSLRRNTRAHHKPKWQDGNWVFHWRVVKSLYIYIAILLHRERLREKRDHANIIVLVDVMPIRGRHLADTRDITFTRVQHV